MKCMHTKLYIYFVEININEWAYYIQEAHFN